MSAALDPELTADDGPEVGLPPDLVVHEGGVAQSNTTWHFPREVWRPIRKLSKGKGARVAVLDTGVSPHNSLPQPIAHKSFIRGQSAIVDRNGHGTHCAGTVLSRDEDIGAAPEAELLAGKCLSDGGSGSSSGIAASVNWAVDEGADVISMSLGGGSPYQPTINAIKRAISMGRVVVIAAGNSGFNGRYNSIGWPARSGEGVCVAALQQNGTPANFSSGGSQMTIAAPGQSILSCSRNGSSYVMMSGTCVAEGSYVYGPNGPRKIEDVEAGETVFAYEEGQRVERVVAANWDRGNNGLVGLSAMGRDVEVTETHEMLCFDQNQKDLEWVRAKDIDPTFHRLVVARQMPHQVNPYLDRLITNDFAYLLGYLLADGWISETTRGKRTCVSDTSGNERKSAALERAKEIYHRITGKQFSKHDNWFYDDSTRMALILEASGLQGDSAQKTLPYWVWNVSERTQDAILNGYAQADANLRGSDDTFRMETVSQDLVRKIACLADYRGYKRGRVRWRERSIKAPNSKIARWSRTHQLSANFGKFIGTNARTAFGVQDEVKATRRMRDMGLNPDHYALGSISIHDQPETKRVYDLTVPGADNFVTQGLVTHNSMATPFVAGCFALIVSIMRAKGNPSFTSIEAINAFIKANTKDLGTPGHDPATGFGQFNMLEVMEKLANDQLKFV